MRAYCETRGLPADLQQRLLSYFEFQQQKAMDSDGSRILRALPDSLRMKVASHQYSYVIQRNSQLFKGCNLQFLNQLMLKLREMYLMPGEALIRAGDMSRELAFVARVCTPFTFMLPSLHDAFLLFCRQTTSFGGSLRRFVEHVVVMTYPAWCLQCWECVPINHPCKVAERLTSKQLSHDEAHQVMLGLPVQGVIAEVREDSVIRSVREDSESSCVGEIAFFMGIAQPRTFQVTFHPTCDTLDCHVLHTVLRQLRKMCLLFAIGACTYCMMVVFYMNSQMQADLTVISTCCSFGMFVIQARSTGDVTLLVISKFDYEELVHNYPEQNDIIVTNVLSLFGLDKDGNDSSVSKDTADTISDDAKEKLR